MVRKQVIPPGFDYKVSVLKRDIDSAVAGNATQCAIAHAIINAFPNVSHVRVTKEFISMSFTDSDLRLTFHTPLEAKKFITAFDNKRHPQPFVLELHKTDFCSMKPRRMQQREDLEHRARVNRTIREVAWERGISKDDAAIIVNSGEEPVRVFDDTGWVENPWRAPKKRAPQDKIQRSKRETVAEAYERLGISEE